MQFWSLEGADEALGDFSRIDRLDSRTVERGHAKTFACWLWTWNVAHIPTTRALWVLKRGAGCVDEIIGYSPPDRRIPSPPGVRRYDMLIHVDRMEDWTPLSPRSSHSGQSGFPSSSEDDDDRPFPRTEPGSWAAGVEDGQAPGRRAALRAPASGCRGGPRVVDRRDQDRDGEQGGLRRTWKDAFLGNSCHAKGKAIDVVEAAPRPRNKAASDRRHEDQTKDRVKHKKAKAKEGPVLRATPPPPLRPRESARQSASEPDPVAQFFSFPAGRALSPPPRTDVMQLEIENAMRDALTYPLAFEDGGRSPPHASARRGAMDGLLEDDILPCIANLDAPLSSPCISTPASAAVGFQVAAITQKVDCLHIDAGQGNTSQRGGSPHLFTPSPTAILDAPPAPPVRPRSSAPPKVRATSAPSRRSARQAASGCTVPVAQRAALRLVQELSGLGPKDRMTPAAAAALLKRFEEPLSHSDIKAIAKLTGLDREALEIAAGMAGADAEDVVGSC
ncbi:uncharacterized protein [Aegilops tauschii subsp. strangulata]|uniref:uncharacterized protein n=1 Tax=Aegilops tauschii subsp. strangulata TaxID=200361 RepID=UPI003CC8D7E9